MNHTSYIYINRIQMATAEHQQAEQFDFEVDYLSSFKTSRAFIGSIPTF
jgi:hypothetical protein